MNSIFCSYTIWYILLGISTIIELIIVFTKVKNRKFTFAFYCMIAGITIPCEMVLNVALKGYIYYPMIFSSPFDNYVAGNLFSQLSISATATFIAVFNLKNYWYFIFAGIYGIIEELFLALGIYKHNWYQTWMTIVALIIIFPVVKKMCKNNLVYIGRTKRYIYILLGHIALLLHTAWAFKLLHVFTFNEHYFLDIAVSLTVLPILYIFLLSNIILSIYFSKIKLIWKCIITSTLYFANYILLIFNLIYIKEKWFFIFTTAIIFCGYLYAYILDKGYNKTDTEQ